MNILKLRDIVFKFLALLIFLLISSSLVFTQEPQEKAVKIDRDRTSSLKQLIRQAEVKVKKIDKKLEEMGAQKYDPQREELAREHFKKGNSLYRIGRLEDAGRE